MPLPRKRTEEQNNTHVKYEDCWAKTTPDGQPGISVEQHCRTAGIVAGMLAEQSPDWLAKLLDVRTGVILSALHDIGKVSPGFQKKCPLWIAKQGLTARQYMGMEEDHAKVSQKTVQDLLPNDMRFWAAIVGAHHGRLKGDYVSSLCDGGEDWALERRFLVDKLIGEFGPLPNQPTESADAKLWFNA